MVASEHMFAMLFALKAGSLDLLKLVVVYPVPRPGDIMQLDMLEILKRIVLTSPVL